MRKALPPDDLICKRVCDALRNLHGRGAAAKAGGISPTTFWHWMHDAEKPNATDRLKQFRQKVLDAERETLDLLVGRVVGASVDDWRAAAWLLQRRWPKKWGEAEERAGANDGTSTRGFRVDDDLAAMSDAEVKAEIERLEACRVSKSS